MTPGHLQDVLDWLRENCAGDDLLLDLIDRLARRHRGDLLQLMHDYRHPERTEDEIRGRIGDAEAAERQWLDLHRESVAIARRHVEEREGCKKAVRYYDRLCAKQENPGDIVADPSWDLDGEDRRDLQNILAAARARPPVPYKGLPDELGIAGHRVLELLQVVRARHLDRRRRHDESRRRREDGRTGRDSQVEAPLAHGENTNPFVEEGGDVIGAERAPTSRPPVAEVRQVPSVCSEGSLGTSTRAGREMP